VTAWLATECRPTLWWLSNRSPSFRCTSFKGPTWLSMNEEIRWSARIETPAGVARALVPIHGGQNVLREIEHVRFVVLARDDLCLFRLRLALNCWIDDGPRRLSSELTMRDCAHLPPTHPEPRREGVEEIPLRLEAKHALEKLVLLLSGVPVHVRLDHHFHRNVRQAPKLAALPKEAKRCAYANQMLVDRLRPEMFGQRLFEGIQRRGIDLLDIEMSELRFDPVPELPPVRRTG